MSRWNHNTIVGVRYNNLVIKKIYQGARLVWELLDGLVSCFGRGYWMNEAPWTDDIPWKNN